MTASLSDLLKTSSLNELLVEINHQVKKKPQELHYRELLFKLHCVDANWEKALIQTETLSLMDNENKKQSELYKNLVFSEMIREKVLSGERTANTFDSTIPPWINALQNMNTHLHKQDLERVNECMDQFMQLMPENAGSSESIGDFLWITDSDGRLGPIFEFIFAGGYRWIPFSAIQEVTVLKPTDILHFVWAQVKIKINDETYYGFSPSRYPLLEEKNQEMKLGLKTEWESVTEHLFVAKGRKMFMTDHSEFSIFEIDKMTMA